MPEEPASLILELLREMGAELATKADLADLATKSELSAEITSLRADVASDILKELSEQIVGLRRAVIDYHTTLPSSATA
jgi:hypothetical protein